jgi:hypothetical protein
MNISQEIKRARRLLIGHGALLIFSGGAIGFAFTFFLIGKVALWPFPGELSYQFPGTYDGWRMAHLEGIMNGFMLWISSALLTYIPLSGKNLIRASFSLIVVGWTFTIAALIDPLFPDSRGLAYTDSISNNIAFFLFYVGVLLVMLLMGVIAYKSFKPENHDHE